MKFEAHSNLIGQHAFLSASNYHWLNDDLDKLTERYLKSLAIQKGTELHELASSLIKHGVRLPKNHNTLNLYVNDAIGYKMTPEQPLYFSPNCFGTADAISFRNNFLRIHDLKTGETDTSMRQLMIYAALFCLEYRYKPDELEGMELRIYQNNEARIYEPTSDEISDVMDKIMIFDKQIEKLKEED